jgi:glucokinase
MASTLGIDIGGTKMATGLVDDAGGVTGYVEVGTPAGDAERIFVALQDAIRRTLADGSVAGRPARIGVGCGGPMEYPAGRVSPLNIPGWHDFPLRDRLAEAYQCPVVVDNDAKAFALGEYWRGAGRGAQQLLGIVVSTGVGGGIVAGGRLQHGAHGNAGHIGHVIVAPSGPRCACGARGCLEAVASGPSIVRAARRALSRRTATCLGEERDLTTAAIATAAAEGDALAAALFRRAGRALGRAIAGAAALLDLDRVVVGGGVSQAGPLLFGPLHAELRRSACLSFTRDLSVLPAGLARQAGVVGAAALVLSAER